MTIISYAAPNYFYTLVKEDGLVENMTVLVLLFGLVILLYRIASIKLTKGTKWLVFHFVIILGLIFGIGEEISWGQRLFSIPSSNFFLEHNLQDEINLHNLKIRGIAINKLVFSFGFTTIFGCFFLASNYLYDTNKWVSMQFDNWGIPVPTYQLSLLLLVATLIVMLMPSDRKWEVWEFSFVVILVLLFVFPKEGNRHNSKTKY